MASVAQKNEQTVLLIGIERCFDDEDVTANEMTNTAGAFVSNGRPAEQDKLMYAEIKENSTRRNEMIVSFQLFQAST